MRNTLARSSSRPAVHRSPPHDRSGWRFAATRMRRRSPRLPRSGQPTRGTPSPPHAVLLERGNHPRRTWATSVAGAELRSATDPVGLLQDGATDAAPTQVGAVRPGATEPVDAGRDRTRTRSSVTEAKTNSGFAPARPPTNFLRKIAGPRPLAPDAVVLSGAHRATTTHLLMPVAGAPTAPVLVGDADGHCHDDEHSSWATPIQSEVDAPFPPCWISHLNGSPT